MSTVANNIRNCIECGNLDESEICQICKDSSRNQNLLCVVETVADLWAHKSATVSTTHNKFWFLEESLQI